MLTRRLLGIFTILSLVAAGHVLGAENGAFPTLRERLDPELQRGLEQLVDALGYRQATREKRLNLALVDIEDPHRPRVAVINGDEMIYAASLPKLAILLGALAKVEAGTLKLDRDTRERLTRMIRSSSNRDATEMLRRIGKPSLASILQSKRYRLYDASLNGGLWVGKDYSKKGLWQRDPLHHLSHGATPLQTARLYYMMETDQLFGGTLEPLMKQFLAGSHINHKFLKGIRSRPGKPRVYRKSGTWRTWHADSALVERKDGKYILVALAHDPDGGRWLERLGARVDELMAEFWRH